jgi:hypothetical protein
MSWRAAHLANCPSRKSAYKHECRHRQARQIRFDAAISPAIGLNLPETVFTAASRRHLRCQISKHPYGGRLVALRLPCSSNQRTRLTKPFLTVCTTQHNAASARHSLQLSLVTAAASCITNYPLTRISELPGRHVGNAGLNGSRVLTRLAHDVS